MAKTVQLPELIFANLQSLKIRLIGTLNRIPTNGDIVRAAMSVAENHYDELIAALSSVENENS